MDIFRTPLRNGYVYNTKLNGDGIIFNNYDCTIQKGTFINDVLHGNNCIEIHYNKNKNNVYTVQIACGTFTNGKKEGCVIFYTFAKKSWNKFFYKSILVKKEIYIYNKNICIMQKIPITYVYLKGKCAFSTIHKMMTTFTFKEVKLSWYLKVKKYFFAPSDN